MPFCKWYFSQDNLRIDSIVTTPVICDELGSIIIYASSDSLPLSYSVEGGLNSTPNNKFFHLKEGVYPIWVKDGLNRIVRDTVTISLNKFPVDIFPKNDTICSLDTFVQFSAAEPGGIWTGIGVDSISGAFDPKLAGNGSFWIKYVLIRNDSCFTNSTRVFVLSEDVKITSSSSFCSSEGEVTLKAEPLGGIWEGDFVNNLGVFDIKSSGFGKFMVHYKVLTMCGYFEVATDTIEILQAPKITVLASIDSSKTKCLPAYINMSYVSDIPVTNCQWTCDWGRELDTCGSFVDSVFKTGKFRVSLKVKSYNNNCVTRAYSTSVFVGNKMNIDFEASKYFAEINEEIKFKDLTPYAKKHDWDFGDGTTSTKENPVHSYKKRGVYNISYRTQDDLTCEAILENRKIFVDTVGDQLCYNFNFQTGTFDGWDLGVGCKPEGIHNPWIGGPMDFGACCNSDSVSKFNNCCPYPSTVVDYNTTPADWEARQTICMVGNIDSLTGVEVVPPPLKNFPPSKYAVRLGNYRNKGQAEILERTILITPANALMALQYFMVTDDPANNVAPHGGLKGLPYFEIRAFESDDTAGVIPCGLWRLNSSEGVFVNDDVTNPNFPDYSTVSNMKLTYTGWEVAYFDFTDKIGSEIKLRITNTDCSLGGHFGYTYLVPNCQPFEPLKDLTICTGDSVTLSSPYPIEGWDLLWSTGDTTERIKVKPTQTTTYTLKVKSKTFGLDTVCTKQMKVTVHVGDGTTPTVAAQNICKGDEVVLKAEPKGGQYSWYKEAAGGTSFYQGDELKIKTIKKDTTFYVGAGLNCLDSARVPAKIHVKNPKTGFIADKKEVKKEELVQFTNQYPGANVFNWNFGDGTTTSLPNPKHVYTEKGIYTVSLVASDTMGCTDSLVKENYILVDTTTGIASIKNLLFFNAYPNPVNNELNLQFKLLNKDLIEIEVFNFFGQMVYQQKKAFKANQLFDIKIDTENFGAGVYLLRLNGTKTTKYFKVLKE